MATKSPARRKKNVPAHSSFNLLATAPVLVDATSKHATPIHIIRASDFSDWITTQDKKLAATFATQKWTAQPDTFALTYKDNGKVDAAYVGVADDIGLYTICAAADKLPQDTYHIAQDDLSEVDANAIAIGWTLNAYRFAAFKKQRSEFPLLVWPKAVDKNRVTAMTRAITMVRNLINLPPNALGPEALASAAQMVATQFKAKSKIICDTELLDQNFPLIYAVGDGSERRPRLVDFTWGNPKHPKVTLVGKGVCFDTGGYDLKPSAAMLLMKKDMGGAAMALGTAFLIMAAELPVRLRVLIPCVENSVSGRAYRPSDILNSRAGLTVEIGNTDAEGRLVMADCLTLASEETPNLLIDYSTLTGAARSALGFELPAMYANEDSLAWELQEIAMKVGDPLWHMPLWQPYKNDVTSPVADLSNSGNNPAGSVTAALFLQHFVGADIPWIHLDHYAWEAAGKPGRPKGGADTGMRATFALIERRFGQAKPAIKNETPKKKKPSGRK